MSNSTSIKLLIFSLLFFLGSGCSTSPNKQQYIDELKATDIAFSKMSEEEGMHKAFLEYIADEGVMLKPNSSPIVGKNTVREMFTKGSDSSFVLTWEPSYADASGSGDLGYTYGIYTLTLQDTTLYGTYVSVWKNVNGQWKWVLDSGNDGLGEL